MKKVAAICLLIVLIVCLAACAPAEKTARGFSMGSEYYVNYTSSDDLDAEIADLLSSIEESFSVKVEGSLTARINAAKAGEVVLVTSEEVNLLADVFELEKTSDGAFNPAILPLVKTWGFDPPYEMNGQVPPLEESIQAAMALSSTNLFYLNTSLNSIVKSDSSAMLDLGAAIKGYAANRVANYLLQVKGVSEALVYIGGTIAAVGRAYEIGVTPPRDSDESYAFRFRLEEGRTCATSGDYERFYIYNDTRYHHILDANTGYPAASGVISATVVHSNGLVADALATAVVVLGAEKGAALIEKCGATGAILTSDKKIFTCNLDVTVKDKSYEIA